MSYLNFFSLNENKSFGYKPIPIVFSDDDIYINYDQWENNEINSLLITALSGSGKSTLAKKIAEEDNAYYVEIDTISFKIGPLHPDRANFDYIREQDKYLYKYFKEKNIPADIMLKFRNPYSIRKSQIINEYIRWLCFERDDLDMNRVVIEGGDVAPALSEIKELSKIPIIIKGTSLFKSILRRLQRSSRKGYWFAIQNALKCYYDQYNKMYKEVDRARRVVLNQEYEERSE